MAGKRRGSVAEAIVALRRETRSMSLRLDEGEIGRTLPADGEVEVEVEGEGDVR